METNVKSKSPAVIQRLKSTRMCMRMCICALAAIIAVIAYIVVYGAINAQADEIITKDNIKYTLNATDKTASVTGEEDAYGKVEIPESVSYGGFDYYVTSLGASCFFASTITSITIPDSVTSIGANCFDRCSHLTSITIPEKVESLGSNCFFSCSVLTNVNILSNKVTSLPEGCFSGCISLTSITIPDSVTSLGADCFFSCFSLTSISIPSGVTSLNRYCFSGCNSLTSITIPNSVTSLSENCFANCTSLTNITIPKSVTSIDTQCFIECSALNEIIFEGEAITNCVWSAFNLGPKDRKYIFEKTIPDEVYTSITQCGGTDESCYFRVKFIDDTGASLQITDVCKADIPEGGSYTDVVAPNSRLIPASTITGGTFKSWSSQDYKNITNSGMVITAQYNADSVDISDNRISVSVNSQFYTGLQIKPSAADITITYKKDDASKAITLVEGLTYSILSYGTNINAGANAGSIKIAGMGSFNGERTINFDIGKNIISTTVSGVEKNYEKTNSAITPEPVIVDASVNPAATLVKGTDYELTYFDNIAVGTAKIIITGKGSWAGTKEITFNIIPSWTRLAGGTAIGTMRAVVNEGWESTDYAIIATNKSYQDALAAAGLAGLLNNAPVLMTAPDTLSPVTLQLLTDKKVKTAIIVGGKSAVSDAVETAIDALNIKTERIAGGTAVGTANEVYKYGKTLNGGWGKDAIVATIDSYQDALSVAPYAYAKHAPIFLTSAGKKDIADSVKKNINGGGFTRTLIVGGVAAVSETVEGKVPGAKRLAGGTAYSTSTQVADFALGEGMTVTNTGVACGTGYQDALAGAALCGKNNSILLLADDNNKNNPKYSTATKYISGKKADLGKCYIFGGEAAVSDTVKATFEAVSK